MVIDFSFFDTEIDCTSINFSIRPNDFVLVDVLRLDQVHPVVSGNKWFKLKYNLLEAQKNKALAVLSFGGAYSNHLHALAYAGKLLGIKTIGYVRGEEIQNDTLKDCKKWGMELHFISRTDYRKKNEKQFVNELKKKHLAPFVIPEGGDNALGEKGCQEILKAHHIPDYDLICCSVGTGTTLKGIAKRFDKSIKAFCALKNGDYLFNNLPQELKDRVDWYNDEHFGGFGKYNDELLTFIRTFKQQHTIDLDIMYTAKMFFRFKTLLRDQKDLRDKRILLIHTGGVQGNRSLKELN